LNRRNSREGLEEGRAGGEQGGHLRIGGRLGFGSGGGGRRGRPRRQVFVSNETVGRCWLQRRNNTRAVQNFALLLLQHELLQLVLHVGAFGLLLLLLQVVMMMLLLLLVAHQLFQPAVVVQVFHEVGLERLLLILQQKLALQVELLLQQLLLGRLLLAQLEDLTVEQVIVLLEGRHAHLWWEGGLLLLLLLLLGLTVNAEDRDPRLLRGR
jgi:hypothetical protein